MRWLVCGAIMRTHVVPWCAFVCCWIITSWPFFVRRQHWVQHQIRCGSMVPRRLKYWRCPLNRVHPCSPCCRKVTRSHGHDCGCPWGHYQQVTGKPYCRHCVIFPSATNTCSDDLATNVRPSDAKCEVVPVAHRVNVAWCVLKNRLSFSSDNANML